MSVRAGHGPQDWLGQATHQIIEAHAFFRAEARVAHRRARTPTARAAGTEEDACVGAVSSTLQDRLFLVAINLTGHDDAQLIFETLNDRGTPLLKADLIKNWLFQPGRALRADVDALGRDPLGRLRRRLVARGDQRRAATSGRGSTSSCSTGSPCAAGRGARPRRSSAIR